MLPESVTIILGTIFAIKLGFNLLNDIWHGFYQHVLPKFWVGRNFVEEYGKWAVVTGCTGGIGRAYVNELAKRGMNIVLISRNQAKLDKVSEEVIGKFGVETKIIAADFATGGDSIYNKLQQMIENANIDIGILVNNVGMATEYPKPYLECKDTELLSIMNVNTKAAVMLSHVVLPKMIKKKKGAIVNISSLGGAMLSPYLSVYGATKAFVDYFSEAIWWENPKSVTGVTIQNVTPGMVITQMTESFKGTMIQGEALTTPSADTFASGAVNTIGFAQNTCGYWGHSLQKWVTTTLFPKSVVARLGRMALSQEYEKAIKKT